jgi:uncharacterized tellurite resistance protein B-like protein
MLASLRQLFGELSGGEKQREHFAEDDYRVAAAALLVHAARIDGKFSTAERDELHAILKARFELDDAATRELVAEAVAVEGEAVDLYRFTSLLNRRLDADGRRRVVEMMWQIAYSDGRVGEFEDNLIWRAADLLHVPSRERIEIRRRVAAAGSA